MRDRAREDAAGSRSEMGAKMGMAARLLAGYLSITGEEEERRSSEIVRLRIRNPSHPRNHWSPPSLLLASGLKSGECHGERRHSNGRQNMTLMRQTKP